MHPTIIALTTLACVAAGAWSGNRIRAKLPPDHLDKDAVELVKLLSRLISTLVAMVLGLLVGSTKGTYDAANDAVDRAAAQFVAIDRHLKLYGDAAEPLREGLRRDLAAAIDRGCVLSDPGLIDGLEGLHAAILTLSPDRGDDARLAVREEARTLTNGLLQSQWVLDQQAEHGLPTSFVVGLVAWLMALFAGFGLLSPPTPTAAACILVGAASIAGAVFLILELGHPFHGLIRASDAPFADALASMRR